MKPFATLLLLALAAVAPACAVEDGTDEATVLEVSDGKADGDIVAGTTLTKKSPTSQFRFSCDEFIGCHASVYIAPDYRQMDLRVPAPIYIATVTVKRWSDSATARFELTSNLPDEGLGFLRTYLRALSANDQMNVVGGVVRGSDSIGLFSWRADETFDITVTHERWTDGRTEFPLLVSAEWQ